MKKATMNSILSLIATIDTPEADEVRAELNAELAKGAEKAQANRDLYASAHDVVINALVSATAPVTMSELWEAVEGDLPDGMTKGKVQYALTHLWGDEIVKVEGKPNGYRRNW